MTDAWTLPRSSSGAAQARLLMLLATICWGIGNVARKSALDDLGPLSIVGWTSLLGAIAIAPFAQQEWRRFLKAIEKSRGAILAACASFAGGMALLQIGLQDTSATNAGFLANLCTVMTPLAAWAWRGAAPSRSVWPAALLALSGAYLLAGGASGAIGWGDLCCIASAALFTVWIIAVGEVVSKHRAPVSLTVFQFLFAAAFCLPAGLATEAQTGAGYAAAFPEIVLIGVVAAGIGFALQAKSQQALPESTAAILMSMESVFSALFAFALLGDQLSPSGYLGAVLMMAGTVVINIWPEREHAPALPDRAGLS